MRLFVSCLILVVIWLKVRVTERIFEALYLRSGGGIIFLLICKVACSRSINGRFWIRINSYVSFIVNSIIVSV